MPVVDQEDVEILAFRLYKQNEEYEKMVWRLAELCKIIQINIEPPDGDQWCDLNAFKTVGDLKEHLKNKELVYPSEDQVKPIAEKLYNSRPEKSKLHWFIAEKTLILEKLKAQIAS